MKKMNLPRPSKGCFLEAFRYLKPTKKHPFEGAGMCLFPTAPGRRSDAPLVGVLSQAPGRRNRQSARALNHQTSKVAEKNPHHQEATEETTNPGLH